MPKVTGELPGWLPAVNRVMKVLQRLGVAVFEIRDVREGAERGG